jgi:uncharacterized lipoprotein YmbA
MIFFYRCTLLTVISILISSCSITRDTNVNYFSINYPQIEKCNNKTKKYQIVVLPFSTNELYGTKMVFRKPPNSVFFDSTNCWAQKPTIMVTNFFTLYLASKTNPQDKNIKKYTLSGKILRIDGNINNKTTNLTIQLELKDNTGNTIISNIYTRQEKMKKLSASAFAQSITKSLNAIASDFYKDINNKRKI